MSEERRARVVEAATAIFVRYGFSRATMEDVAQEAGLSRQALYRLFPNKDELLRAAVSVLELMEQSPDAKDLIEGCNHVGQDIAESTSVRFMELLVSALEPSRAEIVAAGMSPEELAGLLFASASSFKHYATDATHLRKLLSAQVALVGRALGAQ